MSVQKKRQLESDNLNAILANLEKMVGLLDQKFQRMECISSDTHEAQLVTSYQPEAIRRLVKQVRVYGARRIEIDLHANDDFIIEILETVMSKAG